MRHPLLHGILTTPLPRYGWAWEPLHTVNLPASGFPNNPPFQRRSHAASFSYFSRHRRSPRSVQPVSACQRTRRGARSHSLDVVAPHASSAHLIRHTTPRGSMASSSKALSARTRQKSYALRMLLTSGVLRSAATDPPCMAALQPQVGSPRLLSSHNSVRGRVIHSTDRAHRMAVLANWHDTFLDILKEFGKR